MAGRGTLPNPTRRPACTFPKLFMIRTRSIEAPPCAWPLPGRERGAAPARASARRRLLSRIARDRERARPTASSHIRAIADRA
jgi:hypothetical protein